MISNTSTPVEVKKADASHKAKLEDYKNWKAAEDECCKFICGVVEEVWIKEMKDTNSYFHNVPLRDLLGHLKKNPLGYMQLTSPTYKLRCFGTTKKQQVCRTTSFSWKMP